MGGCVQGARAPHNLEAISSVADWWEEVGEESSFLSTSEEKHILDSSRVAPLAHPTGRSYPPPHPSVLVAARSLGAACLACPSQGRCTGDSCTSLV